MRHDDAHANVMEALRLGEQDDSWIEQHPDMLERYRGECVVIYRRA